MWDWAIDQVKDNRTLNYNLSSQILLFWLSSPGQQEQSFASECQDFKPESFCDLIITFDNYN